MNLYQKTEKKSQMKNAERQESYLPWEVFTITFSKMNKLKKYSCVGTFAQTSWERNHPSGTQWSSYPVGSGRGRKQAYKKELEYHKKTKIRDVALLTLLLGTGIRVSECVGLDINDVDFDNCCIKIRRKGGYEAIVYFGEEVETALLDYKEQREHMIPAEGHENALFLSLQNRRMAVRSVENLVKNIPLALHH